MERGKLVSGALVFTVLSTLLIMPPLALLFQWNIRWFGVPTEVVYLFIAWLFMVFGARWFSRRMPPDSPSDEAGGNG